MKGFKNGGFPPLILKNNIKSENNKERFITSDIKKNINIREILQVKKNKNILDDIKKKDTELDIINDI
jgi:hypothetical protein